MANATDHAVTVLSAIIPRRRDLLELALEKLTVDHFPEKIQQKFFQFLGRYADVTNGAVLSLDALEDLLRGSATTGQLQLYTETYSLYNDRTATDEDFAWSIIQLQDSLEEKATTEIITSAMEIVRTGKTTAEGEILKGHSDARGYILGELATLDREFIKQDAPEGDMRSEMDDILSDYQQRESLRLEGKIQGVSFGIPTLDAKVGGLQKGELALVLGYSGDGKTTLCTQLAWSTAVEQGKNVLFLTTETLRDQVRRKIISRHSTLSMFDQWGGPGGINSKDLKAGTLNDAMKEKFRQTVQDLTHNPAYGKLHIAQVPRGETISSMEQRIKRHQQRWNVDLVIMDYVALLLPDQKFNTSREQLRSILLTTKQVATGCAVPFVTPWQVTREAREQAAKDGQYNRSSTAETAEATNSADLIIAMMAPLDNSNRTAEISMQLVKHRDGETANGIIVNLDYATSRFDSRAAFSEALHDGGSDNFDYLNG